MHRSDSGVAEDDEDISLIALSTPVFNVALVLRWNLKNAFITNRVLKSGCFEELIFETISLGKKGLVGGICASDSSC
jgi:hypothetical protein